MMEELYEEHGESPFPEFGSLYMKQQQQHLSKPDFINYKDLLSSFVSYEHNDAKPAIFNSSYQYLDENSNIVNNIDEDIVNSIDEGVMDNIQVDGPRELELQPLNTQPLVKIEVPKLQFHQPLPIYDFNSKSLVRLAHRNKDIKLCDFEDVNKRADSIVKLKKLLFKSKVKFKKVQTQLGSSKNRKSKQMGRPLTPKTKVRFTLVRNLLHLYSMLVSETSISNNNSSSGNNILKFKSKFHLLKSGCIDSTTLSSEITFDDSVECKNKSSNVSDEQVQKAQQNGNSIAEKKTSRYKSQSVTLLETQSPLSSTDVKFDADGSPTFNSVDDAIKSVFNIEEYTFLRITRAAAFEKTGAVVLKMETAHPGDPWLNDDEYDLRLMHKLYMSGDKNNPRILDLAYEDEDQITNADINPSFLKKKLARPRYKSNMKIYLVPRSTNVVLYTRENMLKRDIINGTLNLNDPSDPRMIITAFDYTNVLNQLGVLR